MYGAVSEGFRANMDHFALNDNLVMTPEIPDIHDIQIKNPFESALNGGEGSLFVPGKRRRLNFVGVILGLLTAPIIFVFVMYLLTSEYRFHNPRKTIVWATVPYVWLVFVF